MKVYFPIAACFLFASLSQAMPAQISCDTHSLGQMVEAQLAPPAGPDPLQVYAREVQKQCFVGMAIDMCGECNGITACMQARGQQYGPELIQTTPECAAYWELANSFKPTRRLRGRKSGRVPLNKLLLHAVKNGRVAEVKELLAKGANPDTAERKTRNPLLMVALQSITDAETEVTILKMLLGAGANPNKKNKNGIVALHYCSWHGTVDATKVLLNDPRTNPNMESHAGTTPLALALGNRMREVAALIASDSRTDLDYVSKRGKSALGFAYCDGTDTFGEQSEKYEVQLLKSYGATECRGCYLCPR